MDIFDILTLIGGLCLFLFGMNVMGESLEKRAGGSLKVLLGKLTTNKMMGFLTGMAVTAVIQSSSATTVMVVGFVNSSLLSLRQAINVIMGANVGTTVTAWILSLSGIESSNVLVSLLKPTSFTPIMALVGIVFYMVGDSKKKDTGMILLGFATLMFGMDTMSDAVSGLRDIPEFQQILVTFTNPVLGVLAGALLTAIIQSSSASVGILQALASTGQVTFGMAIPIIMGQNIGTCVTAMLSSVGATKNAKRAAMVHLCFNVIGTAVWLTIFCIAKGLFDFALLSMPATQFGIAVAHSIFNVLCTALLLPMTGILERLACRIIPDAKQVETTTTLDDRLMATPAVAIVRCRAVSDEMAAVAADALGASIEMLDKYDEQTALDIRDQETQADRYEDILGTYLVKMGSRSLSAADRMESAKLLHVIGDFERISDHAVNILESAEEIREKEIHFSTAASRELKIITAAVKEIVELSMRAFRDNDLEAANQVEPLEQVIDTLKEQLRSRHILRLQNGECSIEAGFVWSDLLTNLERVSDHCSNIAGCVIEMVHASLDLHEYLSVRKNQSEEFIAQYNDYANKYALIQE